MTLVDRTSSLKVRCQHLETLGDKIEEARTLGARLGELRGASDGLSARRETIAMLKQAGIAVEERAKSATRARAALTRIRERFAEAQESGALTKGQDWNVLIRELPRVVDELGESALDGWKKHVDRLFAGETPASVERTLAPTDANKAAVQRYRQAYIRYAALRAKTPSSDADIAQLAGVAEELRHVKFDRDVPDAVRKFLEALPTGAPLGLLTAEVREWIEQNGHTNRYRIVPESR